MNVVLSDIAVSDTPALLPNAPLPEAECRLSFSCIKERSSLWVSWTGLLVALSAPRWRSP
jgi:hypothetical protein